MIWKSISIVFLALLFFVFGFAMGGIHWSWSATEHASEVAFWSMLGGWVSGIATLVAVVVSMMVAYQASRSGTEKLGLSFDHMFTSPQSRKTRCFTFGDVVNIRVKNLRSVVAEITTIYMELDGCSDRLNISFLKQGGKGIPCLLKRSGEEWEFAFTVGDSSNMEKVFRYFRGVGNPTFRKGVFKVETTMNLYEIKMEKDLLAALKLAYQKILERESGNQSN